MTHNDETLRQIEENEQWLREVLSNSTSPNVEPIKLAITVALNEEWLRGILRDEIPKNLSPLLKHRLRESVSELQTRKDRFGRRSKGRRSTLRWGMGLAAAAAVSLFFFLPRADPRKGSESLSSVAAFVAFDDDAYERELESLSQDVLDLELSFGGLSSVDFEEDRFDDLMDRIDDLTWDELPDDDWS